MEGIFELIGDLVFEMLSEVTKNKKIPRWIRYPLLMLYAVVFLAVIAGTFILGMVIWPDSKVTAVLLIFISLLFAAGLSYMTVKKVKKG